MHLLDCLNLNITISIKIVIFLKNALLRAKKIFSTHLIFHSHSKGLTIIKEFSVKHTKNN